MHASPAFPTFDEPLAAELGSSDIPGFEPVALADHSYAALIAFHGIEPARLVLVDPHADADSTALSTQRLADLSDVLAADGWQIAIIGDARESERTGTVLGAMQTGALYLAGAIPADTLASLIADARLVVSERARGSAVAREADERGTPLLAIDSHSADASIDSIAGAALDALHAQGAARAGQPFTLHTPMLKDAA